MQRNLVLVFLISPSYLLTGITVRVTISLSCPYDKLLPSNKSGNSETSKMEKRTIRSTEKNWYIFRNNYHLGPFRLEDLWKRFQQKNLTIEDQIWCEGLENWAPIKSYPALVTYFHSGEKNFTGELVPRAIQQEKLLKRAQPRTLVLPAHQLPAALSQWDQELTPPPAPPLPPLPELPLEAPAELPVTVAGGIEGLSREQIHQLLAAMDAASAVQSPVAPPHTVVESHPIRPRSRRSWAQRQLGRILAGALFFGAIFYLWPTPKPINWPSSFTPDQLNRWEKLAYNPSPLPEVGIVALADTNDLLIVTNRAYSGRMDVTFIAEEKKILGPGPVHFVATAVPFHHHLARIEKIHFLAGAKFFPGHYQVEIKLQRTDFLGRLYRFWQQSTWYATYPKLANFFTLDLGFQQKGIYLLAIDSEQEFSKKLQTYKTLQAESTLGPLRNSLENFSTLLSLARKVQELFTSQLQLANKGTDFVAFEQQYADQVGMLLQGMILENLEKVKKNQFSSGREKGHLKKIVSYGKKLGAIVADLATKVGKKAQLTEKVKASLQQEFTQILNNLQADLQANIQMVRQLVEKNQF